MSDLRPEPGLVFPCFYLWRDEFAAGREAQCAICPAAAIVAATPVAGGGAFIAAAPIAYCQPTDEQRSVEMPAALNAHLNLKSRRSWIICNECNEFLWPGLAFSETADGRRSYGMLPRELMTAVRREMLAARVER